MSKAIEELREVVNLINETAKDTDPMDTRKVEFRIHVHVHIQNQEEATRPEPEVPPKGT